ncbi:hypothetical protein [Rufibacter roseus]|uniref:Conjugal transfer protein n=1 Tax=Rufibacter roseus TaxID=1567108 RepID=A0ABW2DLC6_9BACT|nr:hypothetical protein [Rufibacter roseus]
MRKDDIISFKALVSAIMLLICSSCLVSNHEFIPITAKSKAEPIVQGDGYAFECYAPAYLEDRLIIEFKSQFQKNGVRIKEVVPHLPDKKSQPQAVSTKPYYFHIQDVKKAKRLTVVVAYFAVEGDSVTVKQTHELRKVKDRYFTIH